MKTPEVYQETNATPILNEATDSGAQLVAVKRLFMSEICELKREINRLRENINKRDQHTGHNNLYQEYKIKNYYFEQQNYFLKWELTLKQNSLDKLLKISSRQCKDINYFKGRGKKTIDIAKNVTSCEFKLLSY